MSEAPVTDRTALVTGAAGQDGGYLVERLTAEGVRVHVLERPGTDVDLPWLAGATCHLVDLTDTTAVGDLVREVAPDEVYNLAAISSVALSWQEPVLTAAVNGLAVAGLLEAALGVQESTGRPVRVLQASSAEVFGVAPVTPQDERTPIAPVNPYGASKAFAHLLVDVYRGRGLPATAVVLYGHESVRRPHGFVTRKITSTVAAIARGRADELVLGNLDARRDWGWAPDYVAGMVLAVRHPEPQDFVLATGVDHSVADFVEAAFARVGIRDWQRYVRVDESFVRPVEASVQVGDPTRAEQVLGWRRTVDFAGVVGRMVDADLALLDGAVRCR